MRKLIKRIVICMLAELLLGVGSLAADRKTLRDSLIRFHVVANSNSQDDQQVKLLVRDAVLQSIREDLISVSDVALARTYLQENLPKIQELANTVLKAAGFDDAAVVSLSEEPFSAKEYETFSLPAGVYEALRIVIGDGNGDNWWCVTFPDLCNSVTSDGFYELAVEAGMSEQLCQSLKENSEYSLRFLLLDFLGKAENYLHEK